MKKFLDKTTVLLAAVLVVVAAAAFVVLSGMNAEKTPETVDVTSVVDSSCEYCASVAPIINAFRQAGVNTTEKLVEYDSAEGGTLIEKYGIERLPSVIVSANIVNYSSTASFWPLLNATPVDGGYMIRVLQPPYFDLKENRTVGLVEAVYLNDSTCRNCYSVLVHSQILRSLGLALVRESFFDINTTEGRAVLARYKIDLVPAFVVSPDAKYYGSLTGVWDNVGTVEDGWYVFRNASNAGIYKNITSGKVIVPAG